MCALRGRYGRDLRSPSVVTPGLWVIWIFSRFPYRVVACCTYSLEARVVRIFLHAQHVVCVLLPARATRQACLTLATRGCHVVGQALRTRRAVSPRGSTLPPLTHRVSHARRRWVGRHRSYALGSTQAILGLGIQGPGGDDARLAPVNAPTDRERMQPTLLTRGVYTCRL